MSQNPQHPQDGGRTEPQDVQQLSYEQARSELVEVVQRLEAGGASLEESLRLWERGESLAQRCESWLDGAKARLDAARSEASAQESASATGED